MLMIQLLVSEVLSALLYMEIVCAMHHCRKYLDGLTSWARIKKRFLSVTLFALDGSDVPGPVFTIFESYFQHERTEHFVLVLYSGRNNTTGNNVFISWCWKQGSSRAGLGPEYQRTGQGVPCYSAGSIFRGQTCHRWAVIYVAELSLAYITFSSLRC